MQTPSTQRSPGDHFAIQTTDPSDNTVWYVTSITKAKEWMAHLMTLGDIKVEIAGITPYGRHKVDTCDKLSCKYCASGVGQRGRESKEARRAVTRAMYSDTQTLNTKELRVGDTILGGLVLILEDRGESKHHGKFLAHRPGRIFKVKYLTGKNKGKVTEFHVPFGQKISTVR